MQAKQSTTEGRHYGIGIPFATRPFAVANKNKNEESTNRMIKLFNQSIGRLRMTKTKISISGLAAVAAVISMLAVAVATARADRQSFNNWHVHDGGNGYTDATGLTHRGVGPFPKIFT